MTVKIDKDELVDELREIQMEIEEKIRRAHSLLEENGFENEADRGYAYWLAHVVMAVTDDHEWLGKSMCTLQGSIDAVENDGEEDYGES